MKMSYREREKANSHENMVTYYDVMSFQTMRNKNQSFSYWV